MRLRPIASMGTPATMAGRVQARNRVSSVSRSSESADIESGSAAAAGDQVDDRRGAEDHDDADNHRAGAAHIEVPEHPGDAGDDDGDHRQSADDVAVEQVDDVLDERADVAADSGGLG